MRTITNKSVVKHLWKTLDWCILAPTPNTTLEDCDLVIGIPVDFGDYDGDWKTIPDCAWIEVWSHEELGC